MDTRGYLYRGVGGNGTAMTGADVGVGTKHVAQRTGNQDARTEIWQKFREIRNQGGQLGPNDGLIS